MRPSKIGGHKSFNTTSPSYTSLFSVESKYVIFTIFL